jgi:hypothetical protein
MKSEEENVAYRLNIHSVYAGAYTSKHHHMV